MWQAVIIMTKWSGYLYRIELVEVIWKTVFVIIDKRLGKVIKFQDVMNRFRDNHRAGKSPLEAKLLPNIEAMREEVLYKLFLDLHNIYDAMN